LFERLAPRFVLEATGGVLDLDEVFGRSPSVVLDIGIGVGDTMLEMARSQPGLDVIGVDVHTPGIANSLAAIEERGLSNVRLVHGDALEFVERLAPSSLTGVRIFFPDPWPKARHHHRRLVRTDVVARLVPLLRPSGWLHLATDDAGYAEEMRRLCDGRPELTGGPVDRPPERPLTRYEQKGLAAGRTVTDLCYVRLDPPSNSGTASCGGH
jgi:tRNA (guanine-N7-)-methyltransferase